MVHEKKWVVTPCSLAGEHTFLRNIGLSFHVHKFSVSIRILGCRMGLKTHSISLFVARELQKDGI